MTRRFVSNVTLLLVSASILTGCGSGLNPDVSHPVVKPVIKTKPNPGYIGDQGEIALFHSPLLDQCNVTQNYWSAGTIAEDKVLIKPALDTGVTRLVFYPNQIDVIRSTNFEQLEADYRDLIQTALATGKQVILTTFPKFYGGDAHLNGELTRLNAIAIEAAYADKTWVMDLDAVLNDQTNYFDTSYGSYGTDLVANEKGCNNIIAAYNALNHE